MTLVTSRGVLLRSYPYSETSRILRFYTDSMGQVGVMARGARAGGGKSGSGLDTFVEGTLTLHVKHTRDLQTLQDFAPTHLRRPLAGDLRRFGGASVLAEIVLKHAGEDANPVLFEALSTGLDRMSEVPADQAIGTLLREGWGLVSTLGYRPVVATCVECGTPPGDALTRFDFAAGGVRCSSCTRVQSGPRLGPGARAQLLALLDDAELPVLERPRAHLRLLADFVAYHVSDGRPLASFDVLAGMMSDVTPTDVAEGTSAQT